MEQKQNDLYFLERYIKSTDTEALRRIDDLEDAWSRIRYEGKLSWISNLNRIDLVLKYFHKEFMSHIKLEEDILFPYIQTHIPRLEYMMYSLCADHNDFRRDINLISAGLDEMRRTRTLQNRSAMVQQMNDTVIYLIHLLRHHIAVESKGIFDVITNELTTKEKRLLEKRILKVHKNGSMKESHAAKD